MTANTHHIELGILHHLTGLTTGRPNNNRT